MTEAPEAYQPPRTIDLAWRLMAWAAVVILLQVIPVGYALLTAESWVPLLENESGASLRAEDVSVIEAADLIAALELIGLAVVVALTTRGVRRGRDWARLIAPAVTLFVLVGCPNTDTNRMWSEVHWSDAPGPVILVAYCFLLVYPLLLAGAVLVLLRDSRRHFIPRMENVG